MSTKEDNEIKSQSIDIPKDKFPKEEVIERATILEAEEIVKLRQQELADAMWELQNANMKALDYENAQTTIKNLNIKITGLNKHIEHLENLPNVKKHKIILQWKDKLHDHLNGHELMNEEDLEDLFTDLQKI